MGYWNIKVSSSSFVYSILEVSFYSELIIIRTYAEEENCEAIFQRSRSEFIILRMHL
jgi:hypothetical protein